MQIDPVAASLSVSRRTTWRREKLAEKQMGIVILRSQQAVLSLAKEESVVG